MWEPGSEHGLRYWDGSPSPQKLFLSLTERCNLRCDHCPRKTIQGKGVVVSDPLLDYVATSLLPDVTAVQLGGLDLGEQLTSPRFDWFLQQLTAYPDINLELTTNLTLLSLERARLIADVCDVLYVSLEGTGSAYERIRHFSWEVFAGNLRMIDKVRRRTAGSRLRIHALVTCFRDNLDSLLPILDLAEAGVDEFRFRRFIPVFERHDTQYLGRHMTSSNRVFDRIVEVAASRGLVVKVPPRFQIQSLTGFDGSHHDTPDPPSEPDRSHHHETPLCEFPFNTVAIRPDGRIGPCCRDIDLGSLDPANPDVMSVWKGQRWQSLRESFVTGELWGPCRSCEIRFESSGIPM